MDENKKIIQVLVAICFLFFIIVGYLTYIQLFRSRDLMANVYNRRQYKIEENTARATYMTGTESCLLTVKQTVRCRREFTPMGHSTAR